MQWGRYRGVYRRRVGGSTGRRVGASPPASTTREAARPGKPLPFGLRGAKDTGVRDYIGAFAVTAGLGAEEFAVAFAKNNDDYSSIMARRWRIVSRRPLPSGCTTRAAGVLGYAHDACWLDQLLKQAARGA